MSAAASGTQRRRDTGRQCDERSDDPDRLRRRAALVPSRTSVERAVIRAIVASDPCRWRGRGSRSRAAAAPPRRPRSRRTASRRHRRGRPGLGHRDVADLVAIRAPGACRRRRSRGRPCRRPSGRRPGARSPGRRDGTSARRRSASRRGTRSSWGSARRAYGRRRCGSARRSSTSGARSAARSEHGPGLLVVRLGLPAAAGFVKVQPAIAAWPGRRRSGPRRHPGCRRSRHTRHVRRCRRSIRTVRH